MHRGFFATALQEAPEDPLSHKYAPSVLAAYNSACSYVGLIKSMYSQYPKLIARMWFYFTHVFSSAVSPPASSLSYMGQSWNPLCFPDRARRYPVEEPFDEARAERTGPARYRLWPV